MSLTLCRHIHGGHTLIEDDPLVGNYEDLLYVPHHLEESRPGLYFRNRSIVPGGGFVLGVPNLHYAHGAPFTSLVHERYDWAPHDHHIFVGSLNVEHYGHFITSGLSRFWCRDRIDLARSRLIYLDPISPTELFAKPYAARVFGLMGLTPDNFVRYEQPVRLRRTTVPQASFEENNCAHRAYAKFTNSLGALVQDTASSHRDTLPPIYLTKHRLKSGVSRVVNEEELCAHLEKNGVEIVSPEMHSFEKQVQMFSADRLFVGYIGSAFHTSVFAPSRKMLLINHGHAVWSNQVLQDRANNNETLYLHQHEGFHHEGADDSFGNNFRIEDPQKLADELTRSIEAFSARSQAPEHRKGDYNIALGKRTQQSSRHQAAEYSDFDHLVISPTSGYLTGSYQFHTANEKKPWLQIDLGAPHTISSIALYNRLDSASWRASKLTILASTDNLFWRPIYVRTQTDPIGGIDGNHLNITLDTPIVSSAIKIESQLHDDFHLDQVMIFGQPLQPPEKSSTQDTQKPSPAKPSRFFWKRFK